MSPTAIKLSRSAWWHCLPPLVLGVLTLIAYQGSFQVPELLDDETSISDNQSIRHLWPLSESFDPPVRSGTGGRPFANFTFALNYAWTEDSLWSYHVVNLAIHFLAAWTLCALVYRTLRRSSASIAIDGTGFEQESQSQARFIALTAAALWAVHPVATIAVTYLSQRTESLMALFYLQTLYGFVRGVAGSSARWMIWSVISCLIGMATKEVMVTAPVAVLLYDRVFIAGSFRAALRQRWRYYLALAATWLLLVILLQTNLHQRFVGFGLGVGAGSYALTESRAILLYLSRAVWPANLVFDYGPEFLSAYQAWPYVVMLLFIVACVGIALLKRPALAFCGVWFLLVLIPTSSVVPIAGQPIAENRIYLPLAAVCTVLAFGGISLLGRRSIAVVASMGAAFTWLAELRNETFETPLEIWGDTIAKRPNNPRAYDQHGEALVEAGRLGEAISDYEHALAINPDSTQTHGLLGNALLALRHPAEAVVHYRQAIKLGPQIAHNYQNMAAALSAVGDDKSAISYYQTALGLDPELSVAHTNLGLLLLKLSHWPEAEQHLRRALSLEADDHRARYALAVVLLQLGRLPEAFIQIKALLQQHPDDADAQNALGVALLRSGRLDEARRAFEHTLRLSPTHADAQANLVRVREATNPSPLSGAR